MRLTFFALVFAIALSHSVSGQKMGGIEGVWSLTEVTTTGTGSSTTKATQPSLYIFTKKYYSIIYVASDAPRTVTTDVANASATELRTVFVDSFIANAGTYDLKGGKLTVHPKVAKSPGYMQPDVYSVSSVKITGDMMTLVSESSNTGPSANPTTFKLKRVE